MNLIEVALCTGYLIALGLIWFYSYHTNVKLYSQNTQLLISNHDMTRRLELLDIICDDLQELLDGQQSASRQLNGDPVIELLRRITK